MTGVRGGAQFERFIVEGLELSTPADTRACVSGL